MLPRPGGRTTARLTDEGAATAAGAAAAAAARPPDEGAATAAGAAAAAAARPQDEGAATAAGAAAAAAARPQNDSEGAATAAGAAAAAAARPPDEGAATAAGAAAAAAARSRTSRKRAQGPCSTVEFDDRGFFGETLGLVHVPQFSRGQPWLTSTPLVCLVTSETTAPGPSRGTVQVGGERNGGANLDSF